MDSHSIYISHAWGGESEKIVREICHYCEKAGLRVTLDKHDLGYRESITAFMQNLGKAEAIILVISQKYLHSEYCMYELLQIYENKDIHRRIFPVVMDEVSIAKSWERLELVRFWEQETETLESKIRELKNLSYIEGITEDLNLYQKIRNNIARLTKILKDINALNISLHQETDYQHLVDSIQKHLNEQAAETSSASVGAGETVEEDPVEQPESRGSKLEKKWWFLILLLVLGGATVAVWPFALKDDGETLTQENPLVQHSMAVLEPESKDLLISEKEEDIIPGSIEGETSNSNASQNQVPSANVPESVTLGSTLHKVNNIHHEQPDRSNSTSRSQGIKSTPPKKTPVLSTAERKNTSETVSSEWTDATTGPAIDDAGRIGPSSEEDKEERVKPVIKSVFIPPSQIDVQNTEDISSNRVKEGDWVYLKTRTPLDVDGIPVLRPHARVRARVIEARASHGGGRGALGIRLDAVETTDGQWLELEYHDINDRQRKEVVFSKNTVFKDVKVKQTLLNLKSPNE